MPPQPWFTQDLPKSPQISLQLFGGSSARTHSDNAGSHVPLLHPPVLPTTSQMLPHLPQFASSPMTLVQEPLQSSSPAPQLSPSPSPGEPSPSPGEPSPSPGEPSPSPGEPSPSPGSPSPSPGSPSPSPSPLGVRQMFASHAKPARHEPMLHSQFSSPGIHSDSLPVSSFPQARQRKKVLARDARRSLRMTDTTTVGPRRKGNSGAATGYATFDQLGCDEPRPACRRSS